MLRERDEPLAERAHAAARAKLELLLRLVETLERREQLGAAEALGRGENPREELVELLRSPLQPRAVGMDERRGRAEAKRRPAVLLVEAAVGGPSVRRRRARRFASSRSSASSSPAAAAERQTPVLSSTTEAKSSGFRRTRSKASAGKGAGARVSASRTKSSSSIPSDHGSLAPNACGIATG